MVKKLTFLLCLVLGTSCFARNNNAAAEHERIMQAYKDKIAERRAKKIQRKALRRARRQQKSRLNRSMIQDPNVVTSISHLNRILANKNLPARDRAAILEHLTRLNRSKQVSKKSP